MTGLIPPKWQTMEEISNLLGIPIYRPTRGSSIPLLFFSDIASQLGIPQQNSMPLLARAIIEQSNLPWTNKFSSEHTSSGGGSTVTALGLLQLKNAILIRQGRAPIPLPDDSAIEKAIEWVPDIRWKTLRDELPSQMRLGVERPGATVFRKFVVEEYRGQCALSRFQVESVLDVAHIVPYYGVESDQIQNAIPLRADLHRLYDRGLLQITFDESSDLYVSKVHINVRNDYEQFDYLALALPENRNFHPSKIALQIKNNLHLD